MQNTWGEDWGENGFFKLKRGTDESAIESLGEAADPIIINDTNFLFIWKYIYIIISRNFYSF